MVLFPHSLHNQHQQHHTTAQNTSKQLAQCNFHHACSCIDRDTYSRLCWPKFSIRLVGTVKFVCFLCEFWWWKVQLEFRIWIGLDDFFPSLTSQPTPAAPHNRTKYQQTTCAMQFSPCLFLHGFCSVFHYAERNTCSGLCWPKFSWGWLVR